MTTAKINNYSTGDSNITEQQLTTDKTFKGMHTVSLTNYNNTSLPAIAAGSCIEINGAFYQVTADETISGSPADGTLYILCTPSTSTFSAAWTTTAPTWSDAKQGFYGTGANVNNRYLEYSVVKSGTSYTKYRITYDDKVDSLFITDLTVTNPIQPYSQISKYYWGNVAGSVIYNLMDSYLPNIGDAMIVSGVGADNDYGSAYIISHAIRVSASEIRLYGFSATVGALDRYISLTSSQTHVQKFSVAW